MALEWEEIPTRQSMTGLTQHSVALVRLGDGDEGFQLSVWTHERNGSSWSITVGNYDIVGSPWGLPDHEYAKRAAVEALRKLASQIIGVAEP